jgi:hypothetical protein
MITGSSMQAMTFAVPAQIRHFSTSIRIVLLVEGAEDRHLEPALPNTVPYYFIDITAIRCEYCDTRGTQYVERGARRIRRSCPRLCRPQSAVDERLPHDHGGGRAPEGEYVEFISG